MLVMVASEQTARDHNLEELYLLENFGFIIHQEKTVMHPYSWDRIIGNPGALKVNGVTHPSFDYKEAPYWGNEVSESS